MKKEKIRLGVNIDHIATLRQVRGNTTAYPDLIHLMKLITKAGADQITLHLREDRRHIQDKDVKEVCAQATIDVNLEMACSDEMVKIALKNNPDWICIVPEKRSELTTEGGLNLFSIKKKLERAIDKVQNKGIEVSLFIEPDIRQVELAHILGADAIEFHTGKWALLRDQKRQNAELNRIKIAADLCNELGMRVHAGHGLDFEHIPEIKKVPYLKELNIGHSIVCRSLEYGVEKTVKKFKTFLNSSTIKTS